MSGLTKGLRRGLVINSFFLFAAGCIAIGVSSFFLAFSNKRRQVILTHEVIYVALSLGALMALSAIVLLFVFLSSKLNKLFLNIFRIFIILTLFVTLGLGAYIWFQSLDVQNDYFERWTKWDMNIKAIFQDEGSCCGFEDTSTAVESDFCTKDRISNDIDLIDCRGSILEFVNYYLQNIYTALFLYAIIDFVTLLMCLVTLKALKDQFRYEKSMKKMINLHNLEEDHLMTPDQAYGNEEYEHEEVMLDNYYPNHHRKESYLPMPHQRASVIYTYT